MSKHGDRMKAAVKLKPEHPTHHGMRMQVHHLISKKSIKKKVKAQIRQGLKKKGYDIDDLDNLISLPNDYWGACHLEVQLHRSDHRNATTDDDGHDIDYHRYVGNLINTELKSVNFDEVCDGKIIQKKMNKISKDILEEIADFEISLTVDEISDNFESGKETGCRDIGSRDGIAVFKEAQTKGTLCKMQNRSDKRNPIIRKPKEHFPTIKKYTLKTGN